MQNVEWTEGHLRKRGFEGYQAMLVLMQEHYPHRVLFQDIEPSSEDQLRAEVEARWETIRFLKSEISDLKAALDAPSQPEAFRPQKIMMEVARECGVRLGDLRSNKRHRIYVTARHKAVCRVKEECPQLSLAQIARLFKRDHTTILYALNKHGPLKKRRYPAKGGLSGSLGGAQ